MTLLKNTKPQAVVHEVKSLAKKRDQFDSHNMYNLATNTAKDIINTNLQERNIINRNLQERDIINKDLLERDIINKDLLERYLLRRRHNHYLKKKNKGTNKQMIQNYWQTFHFVGPRHCLVWKILPFGMTSQTASFILNLVCLKLVS